MLEKLENLIRTFSEQHQEWSSPEGATNKCQIASDKFHEFLRDNDMESEVVEIDPGHYPDIYSSDHSVTCGGKVHEVVKVGDCLVDWTIRQYDPHAHYPTVFPDSREQPAKRRLSVNGGCGNLIQHIKKKKT